MGLLWTAGPVFYTGPAVAAPAPTATAKPLPLFSLSVSPTRLAISAADIGKSQSFDVTNYGSQPINLVVEVSDFTASRDGAIQMQPNAPWSAASWVIASPLTFHLASLQKQKVSFEVKVPANPEYGDHQMALVFVVPAPTSGPNIRLNRGIGTPVYITVPGPITEAVHVSALHGPGFVRRGPITFRSTVVNTGTVHQDFRATGTLGVRVAGQTVRFPDFTVLRSSTRDVQTTWTNPPFMCICHATVTIPGPGGISTRTVRVIIFPWDLLLYLIAGLIALALIFIIARRRYRAQVQAAARKLAS